MRRLFTGLVVAATTAVLPVLALADNQEVANQIAKNLRDSGQLKDYKVGVKYQNGTAWLSGRVTSQEQMNAALKSVFQTSGVTRVVNDLAMGSAEQASPPQSGNSVRFSGVSKSQRVEPASETLGQLEAGKGALAPERINSGEQLKRVLASNQNTKDHADRVPSEFAPTPITRASLTETPAQIPLVAVQRVPGRPIPIAYTQAAGAMPAGTAMGGPIPAYAAGGGRGVAPARYDQPHLPNHAWPSYAAYPNYGALTYPRQYSPTAWPFIGPFYPYPQVPLGWRKVTLEWDDGWWMLDFKD